jgi:hypothetical protein
MFLKLAHTKLEVFHQSQNLALECYRITKAFPKDTAFDIVEKLQYVDIKSIEPVGVSDQ